MNKKIITGISVFAAVIVFAAVSTATRHIHRPGPETVEEKPVCLNDTLTNDMSDIDTLEAMDAYIEKFLKQWEIKGASLSVMRNDSLVYSKGYGWADQEAGEPMTPGKILRMASVSKLITATGIMMLKERGLLTLQDKVFGPDGILNDSLFTASIRYKTMYSITVEQLLRHQGGFTNSRGDPMFSTRDIIRQFRTTRLSYRKMYCIRQDAMTCIWPTTTMNRNTRTRYGTTCMPVAKRYRNTI